MDAPSVADVLLRARRAQLADLAWTSGPGLPPRARGVLPLVEPGAQDSVVLALTYAELHDARSLEVAGSASLVLGLDDADEGGPLLVADCAVQVTADPEGHVFGGDLLDQELRRWPPSRVLADSPLLRREHWWYVPRLLVRLRPVAVQRLERDARTDHLLVVDTGSRLQVEAIAAPSTLTTEHRGPLALEHQAARIADGAATLHGRAISSDRERWSQWSWSGQLAGGDLDVTSARGEVGLAPTPGVWKRWRTQRRLERACRAGLEAAGR